MSVSYTHLDVYKRQDEGFDGVVIHIGEMLGNIECNGLSVTAQAGAALAKVCIAAANEGLSGLEFAYGIPGLSLIHI